MRTWEKGIVGAKSEMREKPMGIRSPVKVLSPFPVDPGQETKRTGVDAVFCRKRARQAGTRSDFKDHEGKECGKASEYGKVGGVALLWNSC